MEATIDTTAEAIDATGTDNVGDTGFDELQKQFDDKGIPHDGTEPAPTDANADNAGKTDDGQDNADTEDKEAVDTPSETDDTAVELTKMQIEAAKQLGLSDDDITALGDKAGNILENAGMKMRQKISELGLIQQKLNKQAKEKKEPVGESDDGEELVFSDIDLLDGEDGAVKLNQLVQSVNTLRGDIAAIQKDAADAQDRETIATCDRFFNGLTNEDYPQFGKGPLRSMTEDSDEYKARRELVDKADVLGSGYESISGYAPPKEQLLNEALTLVAAEQTKAAVRREVTDKISNRSKQRIGRPGGRQAAKKAVDSEAEAKQKLAQAFLDKGIKPSGDGNRKVSW